MVDPKDISGRMPAYSGYYVTSTIHHTLAANVDPSKVQLPTPCCVLITGGGRGLGEAMAVAFARAGASDIVLAARTVGEIEAVAEEVTRVGKGVNVSAVKCDVTLEADVVGLVEVLKERHGGRFDVLINNAGFLDAGWQPLTSTLPDEWKRVFDVNVFGVYLVTRHLLPLLLGTEDGLKTVMGITSMSSHFASPSIAMGMSKLALNRFMEYLGTAYEKEGLMSYALHPGGVKTKMSTEKGKVPEALSESKCLERRRVRKVGDGLIMLDSVYRFP